VAAGAFFLAAEAETLTPTAKTAAIASVMMRIIISLFDFF